MTNQCFRTESDLLGELAVPATVLYGIHTQRALENFPLSRRPVNRHLVHAYGQVKLACARTNHEIGTWQPEIFRAIEQACLELASGQWDEMVVVDALQGGAGTSTNMNVNEVIANRALQLLDQPLGAYDIIHPIEDINLHQSTNDTYPTALRVAAIDQLRSLESDITELLGQFQHQERNLAHVVKVARTQLQDAVLTTLGRSMGAYADALARDRWRVYKCVERLRVINLGGTAVGTGLGAPREFIFRATEHLQHITNMGLARAENLLDATQNTDVLVEVSGILRALAANLLKISSDLRLLASGPDAGLHEIELPARQAGSSIMPGKVNPVIPEAVGQAAIAIAAHDSALNSACSMGCLELNQFYPLIADSLLTEIELSRNACQIFGRLAIKDLQGNSLDCGRHVLASTATATALIDLLGYASVQEVVAAAKQQTKSIKQVVLEKGLLREDEFDAAISSDAVTRLGSRSPSRHAAEGSDP
jgi:aspartate ammonia-lyase